MGSMASVGGFAVGVGLVGLSAASFIAKAEDTPADDGTLREAAATYAPVVAGGTAVLSLMSLSWGSTIAVGAAAGVLALGASALVAGAVMD